MECIYLNTEISLTLWIICLDQRSSNKKSKKWLIMVMNRKLVALNVIRRATLFKEIPILKLPRNTVLVTRLIAIYVKHMLVIRAWLSIMSFNWDSSWVILHILIWITLMLKMLRIGRWNGLMGSSNGSVRILLNHLCIRESFLKPNQPPTSHNNQWNRCRQWDPCHQHPTTIYLAFQVSKEYMNRSRRLRKKSTRMMNFRLGFLHCRRSQIWKAKG